MVLPCREASSGSMTKEGLWTRIKNDVTSSVEAGKASLMNLASSNALPQEYDDMAFVPNVVRDAIADIDTKNAISALKSGAYLYKYCYGRFRKVEFEDLMYNRNGAISPMRFFLASSTFFLG